MKLYLIVAFVLLCSGVFAQKIGKGRVVVEKILAKSIQGNAGGEDPLRSVTVYLPPGYDSGNTRYPVIYYLHGFRSNDTVCIAVMHLDRLLDTAIAAGVIRPVILVMPNSFTKFNGSFYTNSSLTGNWSDFISNDIVQYVDSKYRTIPQRDSRALCGHSMGGNGAIKIGMLHSAVFSSVYALSPARLNWGGGITISSKSYKTAQAAKSVEELSKDFFALEIADLARTYSPDINKPPFYVAYPFNYINDKVIIDSAAVKKWDSNFPINMIAAHIEALKSLKALKLDWGRNDQFSFIPVACLEFSKQLEAAGVVHFAEEYIGDHGNQITGTGGRFYRELLPFFNEYLVFKK